MVSAPMAVVSMTSWPSVLMAPAATLSPTVWSAGRLSPVSMEASMAPLPWMMRPSTGMRSPGRTTIRSPWRMAAIGVSVSVVPFEQAGGGLGGVLSKPRWR